MKIRADVAAMLRAGAHQQDIMRTLHVGAKTVVNTREALRMPPPRRGGYVLQPIETEFSARTEQVDGGHLRWTGYYANGVPKLGRQGTSVSAYRIAFGMRHDREPVGKVMPGCDYPKCVAPDHLEDQTIRTQLRDQLASIFGGTPS
ncbi:hypothetical protein YUYDRAFT_02123 [Streptomyces sp. ScaeMP-e48]|uniref:hypothetical protein n=1 Tax=Streptomyces sp. ScaeMP-e48 TaxID=1100823 RepID=UPI0008239BD8|nr:hypothetical protein [Streptomyces sp. ScaeMP-e48]SCK20363.1 hypothetical protein YUYDRAFT_02123 [Streptomyces sp. ScaeMP-e48]